MVLGMIPDVPLDKVQSAGNAAGTGARIALCNISSRSDIEEMVGKIEKIETAIEPKFQDHFVAANAIPHKLDSFPQLSKVVNLPKVHFQHRLRQQKTAKASKTIKKYKACDGYFTLRLPCNLAPFSVGQRFVGNVCHNRTRTGNGYFRS
jgi:uncharacterized 2Fe-2S/4Fe-4S cluster protein (DUF4445 family)